MRRQVFMLVLAFLFSGCQRKPEDPHKIYEQYRGSVVLVKNQFYYSVDFNTGFRLFFVPGEQGAPPVIYTDESEAARHAMVSFGTGFFIGREGQIATNRHVVDPSAMGRDAARSIAERISAFRNELNLKLADRYRRMNEIRSYFDQNYSLLDEGGRTELRSSYALLESQAEELRQAIRMIEVDPESMQINAHVMDIGIAYDDTYVTSIQDFRGCIVLKSSKDEGVDLAVIQLKDKRTPDHIKKIFELSDHSGNGRMIRVPAINDDVYMIGFNEGLELALTRNGIKSQLTTGKITQEPDEDRMLYSVPALPGSSGSPVIDRYGNLVAVNFAKLSDSQGFSFGIPVARLKALVYGGSSVQERSQTSAVGPVGDAAAHLSAITGFVKAEDNRDFDRMYSYLAVRMERYWDLANPDYASLLKRYRHIWSITANSRNYIREIRKIDTGIYDLYTEYEYDDLRQRKTISISSRVRFHFDAAGKIVRIYGVE